jgi:hypothetical protein
MRAALLQLATAALREGLHPIHPRLVPGYAHAGKLLGSVICSQHVH